MSADSTGKAVLVFTSTTIIFLPLSFLTSYFALNFGGTNLPISESYFWTICGPVAAIVLLISCFYAFRQQILASIWMRQERGDEV
jgi:Mg2+ and Co2+ transporter CorA